MTDAPDFHYGYLPASVGMMPKSKSEWCVYIANFTRLLPDFNVCDICLCYSFILPAHLHVPPQVTILNIHDTSEPGPVVAHVSAYLLLSTLSAPLVPCQRS